MHCVAKRYLRCGPIISWGTEEGKVVRVTYQISGDGEPHEERVVYIDNTITCTPADQAPTIDCWVVETHNIIDWMPEHEFRQHYTIIGLTGDLHERRHR